MGVGDFPPRRGARFIFIADAVDGPDASDDVPQRVWWRVTAANNRVLGRSARVFGSLVDCRAHATALQDSVDDVVTALSSDSRGQWTWSAVLHADVAARSTRPFLRRIDCVRTLALFLAAARLADVEGGDVRHFAQPRFRTAGPQVAGR
jgi:hypothetical protein